MTAAPTANVLVASNEVDDRLFDCLENCRTTFVRTFEEAQRALRDCLFRVIVIDLNFDNVRTFDLLQYVRSLADFDGVPVLCVQASQLGAGFAAAFDRLIRTLGGKTFIDLRGEGEMLQQALQRLCQIVAVELGMDRPETGAASALTSSGTPSSPREPIRLGSDAATRLQRSASIPKRLCILIIDANIDAAHMLGKILEEIGHDVDFAYGGPAGLDAARRLRPDVVFVDLALPGLDPYQVARRLRADADLLNVRLIALRSGDSNDAARTRADGFDDSVDEPVDAALIRELLGKGR